MPTWLATCLRTLMFPFPSNLNSVNSLPSSSAPPSTIICSPIFSPHLNHQSTIVICSAVYYRSPIFLPFVSSNMVTHFEPPLGGTFWAYRQAINDVVQWVASRAKASGSAASLFEKPRPKTLQSFVQKLKEKDHARPSLMDKLKVRKRNPTRSTRQAADASLPLNVDISYKTLSKFGRAIANTSKIEVDYNVLVVLKGIIHARKGFAT